MSTAFWSAFWAFTFGAAILELVSIAVGLIGYWGGRHVRAEEATVPISAVIPPSPL